MALTNTQYNSIMRLYEQRQTKNRHLRDERIHYVYTHVSGYQKLDESVATLSVAQGKKMLNGDPNALSELKECLHKLTKDKQRLLNAAGLPADFLEPVFDCPDCRDTGYVDGKKCHCFRQAEIELLYQQSKLKDVLEKENFDTLSYDFFEGEQLAAFQTAVNKCRDFARSFSRLGSNLFFYGTVGTGKTFLSNCIARESIELFFGYVWFVAVFCNDLAASICRRTCISRISEQATQHIGCPLVGFCIIRLSQNSLFVSHWGFNTLLI